jgi:hypothetical protein
MIGRDQRRIRRDQRRRGTGRFERNEIFGLKRRRGIEGNQVKTCFRLGMIKRK